MGKKRASSMKSRLSRVPESVPKVTRRSRKFKKTKKSGLVHLPSIIDSLCESRDGQQHHQLPRKQHIGKHQHLKTRNGRRASQSKGHNDRKDTSTEVALKDYASQILAGPSDTDDENENDDDDNNNDKTLAASDRAAMIAFAHGIHNLVDFDENVVDPNEDVETVEAMREEVAESMKTRFHLSGCTPDVQPSIESSKKSVAVDSSASSTTSKKQLSFDHINQAVIKFLESVHKKLQFPALNRLNRWKVHQVADLYRLESTTYGPGKKKKHVTLFKKNNPFVPNEREIEEIRKAFQEAHSMTIIPGFPTANKSTVAADGIVGGDSTSLGPSNAGYALLERLGWRPGSSLGIRNGRVDPISVMKRPHPRFGLGAC